MPTQRAADIIFDQTPSAPLSVSRPSETSTTTTTTTTVESFDIDDSEQQGLLSNEPSDRGFRRVVSSRFGVHITETYLICM